MLVIAVRNVLKAGAESDALGIFHKLEAASRTEPGCLMYVVHQSTSDPRVIVIYEQYKDEAAIQAHRESKHYNEYVPMLKPLVESQTLDIAAPISK